MHPKKIKCSLCATLIALASFSQSPSHADKLDSLVRATWPDGLVSVYDVANYMLEPFGYSFASAHKQQLDFSAWRLESLKDPNKLYSVKEFLIRIAPDDYLLIIDSDNRLVAYANEQLIAKQTIRRQESHPQKTTRSETKLASRPLIKTEVTKPISGVLRPDINIVYNQPPIQNKPAQVKKAKKKPIRNPVRPAIEKHEQEPLDQIVVREGDTFMQILLDYKNRTGMDYRKYTNKIITLNKIKNPSLIRPGQVILMPTQPTMKVATIKEVVERSDVLSSTGRPKVGDYTNKIEATEIAPSALPSKIITNSAKPQPLQATTAPVKVADSVEDAPQLESNIYADWNPKVREMTPTMLKVFGEQTESN